MRGKLDQVGKVGDEVCQDCQLCHAKILHEKSEKSEKLNGNFLKILKNLNANFKKQIKLTKI